MKFFRRIAVTVKLPLLSCLLLAMSAVPALAATRADLLTSTVRIRYERTEGGALITGHGTAFGVDLTPYGVKSRRLLLSAAHNVLDGRGQPYATLKIEINEGTRTYWSRCRVVASDESMDLCLVESGDDLPALARLGDTDLQPGSPVILAGSPRGIPVALFDGEVMRRFDSGSIRSAARVKFDHGDSGGPFFCAMTMKVAGVAVAGVPKNGDLDHTVGLFVPLVGIDSFLQAHLPSARSQLPVVAARSVPHPATQKASAESIAPPAPVEKRAEVMKVDPEIVKQPTPAAVAARPLPEPAKSVPAPQKAVPQFVEAPVVEKKPVAAAPAPAQAMPPEPKREVSPPVPAPMAKVSAPAPVIADAVPAKIVHVVQAGDNLTKIARQYNVAILDIVNANDIKDPNRILTGTRVLIPQN